MPIFRSRHSNGSALPVEIAISGMSPSVWLRGRRVRFGSTSAWVWHGSIAGSVTCRRHFPTCTTSGMFCPVGMLLSLKLPSEPVTVIATASPETGAPHLSQLTPCAIGAGVLFGT